MAMTLDELAELVDSELEICITDEISGATSITIPNLQLRVGAGPTVADVAGNGADAAAARTNYASKLASKVVVISGQARGYELRIPSTLVGA